MGRFYYRIQDIYYNIKDGIRNLINFVPVIWSNRDWDYISLFQILHKKFELMEKVHINGHLVRSGRTAKQLMIVKNLCKRLADDEYIEMATKEYDKKYPPVKFITKAITVNGVKLFKLIDTSSTKEKQDRQRACKKATKMRQQDIELLTKLINKHVLTWWD